MNKLNNHLYSKTKKYRLYHGDALKLLKLFPDNCIDIIVADPPYFLSSKNGISYKNGEIVSSYKGKWDEVKTISQKLEFNQLWLEECFRILKSDGVIWVFGSKHNIYSVGVILEKLSFQIMNNIVWVKPKPMPIVTKKYFAFANETIIWAKKMKTSKHIFNYHDLKSRNLNYEMSDVWCIPTVTKEEKQNGYHPTQKPVELLMRIIQASKKSDSIVLDPFAGSSTTGVASLMNQCYYIGLEQEEEYLKISEKRLNAIHFKR